MNLSHPRRQLTDMIKMLLIVFDGIFDTNKLFNSSYVLDLDKVSKW